MPPRAARSCLPWVLSAIAGLPAGCASLGGARLAAPDDVRTITSIGGSPVSVAAGEPGAQVVSDAAPPAEAPSAERVIAGRVVDERGQPAADATVRLAIDGTPAGRAVEVATDETGRFTLANLRAGSEYTLIAEWRDGEGALQVGRARVRAPESRVEIALESPEAPSGGSQGRIDRVSSGPSGEPPVRLGVEPLATEPTGRDEASGGLNFEDLPMPAAASDLPAAEPDELSIRQDLQRGASRGWQRLGTAEDPARPIDRSPEAPAALETIPLEQDIPNPLPPAREPDEIAPGRSPGGAAAAPVPTGSLPTFHPIGGEGSAPEPDPVGAIEPPVFPDLETRSPASSSDPRPIPSGGDPMTDPESSEALIDAALSGSTRPDSLDWPAAGTGQDPREPAMGANPDPDPPSEFGPEALEPPVFPPLDPSHPVEPGLADPARSSGPLEPSVSSPAPTGVNAGTPGQAGSPDSGSTAAPDQGAPTDDGFALPDPGMAEFPGEAVEPESAEPRRDAADAAPPGTRPGSSSDAGGGGSDQPIDLGETTDPSPSPAPPLDLPPPGDPFEEVGEPEALTDPAPEASAGPSPLSSDVESGFGGSSQATDELPPRPEGGDPVEPPIDGVDIPPPLEPAPEIGERSELDRPRTWGELVAQAEGEGAAPEGPGMAGGLDAGASTTLAPTPAPFDGEVIAASCRFDRKSQRIVDFELPDLSGRPTRFRDLDAELILVDFWGTWCGPCVRAIPHLVALQERFGPETLRVVGIAYELEGTPRERAVGVASVARRLGINYPVLLGEADGQPCPLQEALHVQAYPTLVLLDRDGRIQWRGTGADPRTLETLSRVIAARVEGPGGRGRSAVARADEARPRR